MGAYFEIAFSAASGNLCLFTGTGFSKSVTENEAPGWQELLEECCEKLNDGTELKKELFPSSGENPLGLEEAAQVIDLELQKEGKSIHKVVSTLIKKIKVSGDNQHLESFFNQNKVRVVTTNYDKLVQSFYPKKDVVTITPGKSVPRLNNKAMVYHIHGSVDAPDEMVVTSNDYFKFLNKATYYSRKLSTILHENTVVILGYSLGDTNLNTILNDYRVYSKDSSTGSSIFFVSRRKVSQSIKSYYFHSFGIRVLDNLEVNSFFWKVNLKFESAKESVESSTDAVVDVLNKDNMEFTKEYIREEQSFYEIISVVRNIGERLDDEKVAKMIGEVLQTKRSFSNENNAWEEYVELAKWLVYLGSIVEIEDTAFKTIYLTAVERSMSTMSEDNVVGRSWHAFNTWKKGWKDMLSVNKDMIISHQEEEGVGGEAKKIIYLP